MPKAEDIKPYTPPELIIKEDENLNPSQVRFYLSDRGETVFATLEFDHPDQLWVLRWVTNKAITFDTQQNALAFVNRSYLNMANTEMDVLEVYQRDWAQQISNFDKVSGVITDD